MVIQHNISAMNAHRNMGINNSGTAKNLEKLSSGFKINRAGDDAAGLAISEKMRGQIRGLAMAEQNTSNGISLIQTAEGGLNETHAILQRMRELAVQSSNGTYQDDDRAQLAKEFDALKSEIDRIAESTHYNGKKLLDGSMDKNNVDGEALTLQIGANGGADQRVELNIANMDTKSIGIASYTDEDDNVVPAENLDSASIANMASANKAIEIISAATDQVSGQRAELGAMQNRLEHTLNNLGTAKENLTAAESSIRDVDMAKEMMEFTKNNILNQASQAMLAQANQLPQGVLQLLR